MQDIDFQKNKVASKFFGADTNNWLGIVLPYDSQKAQANGWAGFGNRVRVAIMGHHSAKTSEIKDDEILFALVVQSVEWGSGAAGSRKSVSLSQGDVVIGFFLDPDTRQQPVVTGVLGRTADAKFRYGKGRYSPKPGWVGSKNKTIMNPGGDEYSENKPLCTPKAVLAESTEKSNEQAKEALEKAGLEGNKLDAIPEPEKVTQTEEEAKEEWLKKTSNSPAAKSGSFSDNERWALHKKTLSKEELKKFDGSTPSSTTNTNTQTTPKQQLINSTQETQQSQSKTTSQEAVIQPVRNVSKELAAEEKAISESQDLEPPNIDLIQKQRERYLYEEEQRQKLERKRLQSLERSGAFD